ncbi:YiiX/YebB-like N1pC/P60 family cysteine hydrolase [Candidatus Leptofilum sp.]|uniref:YiiX/YebB-like N1pC/P60 family cysteine hydrolase n=1 Tax=Candidatus Leptofilum sp. TaxID=3241576 RepID=UPI003B5B09BD
MFAFHPIVVAPTIEKGLDFSILLDQSGSLKSGDLIFRRGIGAGRRIVELVDEQSQFSHVGLIQVLNGETFVIHAMPEALHGAGWVRQQALADFLSESTAVAIYRLKSDYQHLAETAVAQTIPWIDTVPFDNAFDFSSPDSLYCTELVWLAYQQAGIDLVDGQFDELELPFQFDGTYLLPSRLSQSPYLQTVVSIPNNLEEK